MHSPAALTRRMPLLDRELLTPIALAYALGVTAAFMLYALTDLGAWLYGILVALTMSVLVGRFLGRTVWPGLGLAASKLALRFHLRKREDGAILHLTPFQDFPSGTLRKTGEATAFATGLAVILASGIVLVTSEPDARVLIAGACAALVGAVFLTVILVPRWLFARLGARIEIKPRFIVRSIAEEHGRIMHVSDGAIVVFALFFGVNALAATMDRWEGGLLVATVLLALASVSVVMMATGAAYFAREEPKLVQNLSAYARRIGFQERWRRY